MELRTIKETLQGQTRELDAAHKRAAAAASACADATDAAAAAARERDGEAAHAERRVSIANAEVGASVVWRV